MSTKAFHGMTKFTKRLCRRIISAFGVLTGEYYAYRKKENDYHWLMFSQEGEDGILRRIFENQAEGFYVDVGAHDPQRFSNTYFFYMRGWDGINIEPNPGSIKRFNKIRPRDKNLEIGVAEKARTIDYYQFEESALNTFDAQTAMEYKKNNKFNKVAIEVKPLKEILQEHLPKNQTIDFMTIDAEGFDEEILKSNDWEKYRPAILLIESRNNETIQDACSTSIHAYLVTKGYNMISKCINTQIYKSSESNF